jgi:hypothetical protein
MSSGAYRRPLDRRQEKTPADRSTGAFSSGTDRDQPTGSTMMTGGDGAGAGLAGAVFRVEVDGSAGAGV